MKYILASIVTLAYLQSCASMSEVEMKKLVYLTPKDLRCFSQFRQQLLNDSAELWKQDLEVNKYASAREWMHTNSYYLDKIDSVKYATFFSHLEGKLVDDITINKKGCIIFTIKRNTERHWDTYHNTYYHDIISANCEDRIKKGIDMIDEIYVDSAINKNWRYASYKVLTGH